MRAKKPFTLVKRKRKNLTVWLYRTYSPEGVRLEYSTGLDAKKVSRTAAEHAVYNLALAGKLIPERKEARDLQALTFGAFADAFFDDKGDFARRRAATGRRYSGNYLAASDSALRIHLLPAFKRRRLSQITRGEVEAWTLRLLDAKDEKGAPRHSPKSVRNILQALGVILGEAARQGAIPASPVEGAFQPPKAPRKKKDALRPEELRRLFAPGNLAKTWQGSALIRGACLVAASTGARLGEVLAIHGEDVGKGYLEIRRSWSVIDEEKTTKSGKARVAPLPKATQAVLDDFKKLRGDGLLFTINGERPISARHLQERFTEALTASGISPEEQEERGLTFHCLRVTYNSLMRAANVSDAKIQAAMGHASTAMTDRYTSFKPEDLAEIKKAAELVFTTKKSATAQRKK